MARGSCIVAETWMEGPMAIGRSLAVSLTLLACGAVSSSADEPQPWPFLRKVIGLTDAQLAAVRNGQVVAKQLPSPDKPEIAAFGVVRIDGTIDALRQKLQDYRSFRKIP